MIRHNTNRNLTTRCYPKRDQPFEIDGNLGLTAGIAAMLLQSRLDLGDGGEVAELHLLPALPAAWPDGTVRGLRAHGGAVVDLRWRAGRLAEAVVRAQISGVRRVRCETPLKISSGGRMIEARNIGPAVVEWNAQRGHDYVLAPKETK
jgi:alpha-L-fucosidase 2